LTAHFLDALPKAVLAFLLSLPSVSLSSPPAPTVLFFFLFPAVDVPATLAFPAAVELVGVAFPLPLASAPFAKEFDTGVGAEFPGVEAPVSNGESYEQGRLSAHNIPRNERGGRISRGEEGKRQHTTPSPPAL
jgi:hypothetical protein